MYKTPREAEAAFYDAFQRADLDAMKQVWANDDDVMDVLLDGCRRANALCEETLAMAKDAAQLRRGIESLAPDVYEALSYYERWAGSAAFNAIEQGLVTQEELDRRIAAIETRENSG